MWQLSDSFSDEKNHKAVSHPAVLLMLIKLNYPLLALIENFRNKTCIIKNTKKKPTLALIVEDNVTQHM